MHLNKMTCRTCDTVVFLKSRARGECDEAPKMKQLADLLLHDKRL